MDADVSQQQQADIDAITNDLPSSKLMNGRDDDDELELPINGKIENETAEQKASSDIDIDGTDGSEQETEQYMNGMESTDVNNDDDDEEEEETEAATLDNHFSMQADDDYEDENEEEEEEETKEDVVVNDNFSKYKSKMTEYEELKAQNANIHTMHFKMLQAQNTERAIHARQRQNVENELNAFKEIAISALMALGNDYSKQQDKIQTLQQNLNASHMERKKIQIARDKMLKQKENENKSLRAKNNEVRTEYTRIKQSVEKIKRENELGTEQIVKKMAKMEEDKEKLNKQLEKQKELVEQEKREKMAVSDKNSEYLRNEKIKISKALDKERKDRMYLEEKVIFLQDECKENASKMKKYMAESKKMSQTEKSTQNMMARGTREKEECAAKLLEKTKYFKQQQTIFDAAQSEVELLKKQCANSRNEMKKLHECIRKKTEKEKEFTNIRKKLSQREKKLDDREKNLRLKYKKENKGKHQREQREYSSPRKVKEFNKESKDPLAAYRHLLPFHWISLVLFIVLMFAVAQKR